MYYKLVKNAGLAHMSPSKSLAFLCPRTPPPPRPQTQVSDSPRNFDFVSIGTHLIIKKNLTFIINVGNSQKIIKVQGNQRLIEMKMIKRKLKLFVYG